MHIKTLYMSFIHAINHGGQHGELTRLRGMVQDVVGIHITMPDKTLADVLRRKLFIKDFEIPEEKVQECHETLVDIFGEDYEDLFKL